MLTFHEVEVTVYKIAAKSGQFGSSHRIDRKTLVLPECVTEEYGETVDYHQALRPAINAMWNTADYAFAESYSADGIRIGNQGRR